MTAPLKGVSFAREMHDRHRRRRRGESLDGPGRSQSVLVYDRFDVWELDPSGARAPVMVDRFGRAEEIGVHASAGGGR